MDEASKLTLCEKDYNKNCDNDSDDNKDDNKEQEEKIKKERKKDKNGSNNDFSLIIESDLKSLNPILALEWVYDKHETLNTKIIKLHSIDTTKINEKDILIVTSNKPQVSLFKVQECDWKVWNLSKTHIRTGTVLIESNPNYQSYFGFIRSKVKISPQSQATISGHYIPLKKGIIELPRISMLNEEQDSVISEFITENDKIFCTDF